jgi:hypothetical protein
MFPEKWFHFISNELAVVPGRAALLAFSHRHQAHPGCSRLIKNSEFNIRELIKQYQHNAA